MPHRRDNSSNDDVSSSDSEQNLESDSPRDSDIEEKEEEGEENAGTRMQGASLPFTPAANARGTQDNANAASTPITDLNNAQLLAYLTAFVRNVPYADRNMDEVLKYCLKNHVTKAALFGRGHTMQTDQALPIIEDVIDFGVEDEIQSADLLRRALENSGITVPGGKEAMQRVLVDRLLRIMADYNNQVGRRPRPNV